MASKFAGLGLAVDAPTRMTILHPITRQPLRDDEGNEAWIDLLAADSPQGRAHDRTVLDNQLRTGGRRLSSETMDAQVTEKLAKLTKGWRLLDLSGNPIDIECNQQNARELYAEEVLSWLRNEVLIFISDLGNFRRAASPS